MCGRFNVTDDPATQAVLASLGIDLGPLPVRYNIAPTEKVTVAHQLDGEPALTEMRWWLVPGWSDGPSQKYAMFNARSETLSKSRAFRGPFKNRRAIIPASSFVEWQKTPDGKQPFLIEQQDQALAFAALWELWEGDTGPLYSCSIVTTQAAPAFEWLHKRMPVMLTASDAEQWLDKNTEPSTLTQLFEPVIRKPLVVTPVDQAINNARNKIVPLPTGASRKID